MIIGRGTIASIIQDRDGFTFFACGESNRFPLTMERKMNEYGRLLECNKETMLVYISGLNIYYPEDQRRDEYTEHKLVMEKAVRQYFPDHCIFRLGSVTWGDNPNTLVNYIRNQIAQNGDCEARPVYRYLNSKEELVHWFGLIPRHGQHEMNITGQLTWMPDLIDRIKKGEF